MKPSIEVYGAKENNLKNISFKIPKYKLVAITGPSGSGKSTVAMDILQRECQRQYAESLGILADGLNKPYVDKLIGLSPSISISQRALLGNVKSTVGTYTEILTFLRILYAKLGVRACMSCGELVYPQFNADNENIKCPHCKTSLKPLSMANFSFNKPEGMCLTCHGHGLVTDIDLNTVVDTAKTVKQGAFILWEEGTFANHYSEVLEKCGAHYGFSFDVNKPVKDYNELESLVFYHGVDDKAFIEKFPDVKKPKKVMDGYFKGVYTFMQEKAIEGQKKELKNSKITQAFTKVTCHECHGSRLNKEARNVMLHQKTLPQLMNYDIQTLYRFIEDVHRDLEHEAKVIAEVIVQDLQKRCENVIKIGLGYLSINRELRTLSGGEGQRLKLANVIDSGLTGVIYILDEPTTGLHPQDVEKLVVALRRLRDLGNTIIVIEHDTTFIASCDEVIDFGPQSGVLGGQIVAQGTPLEVMQNPHSVTGPFLKARQHNLSTEVKKGETLHVMGAHAHNLKDIDVELPLHQLVCFTGASGSGKSSLVIDVVGEFLKSKKAPCKTVHRAECIKQVVMIDQKPIGRLSRSNVATYTDIFTEIRTLFANLEQAKKKKLKVSDFSFNVKGGRCEHCQGLGVIELDMQFLDNIEVQCPVCHGQRFNQKVLSIMYEGYNINDILNLTAVEALNLFESYQSLKHRFQTLIDVGLGYLLLGQSTNTLSGGECQRLKLSKELGRKVSEQVLYILDEPTTGLHPQDIEKILTLLRKLVAEGHSVFVIEHELEVMIKSDYIIDLGVGGGNAGGKIVAVGTPLELSQHQKSITGRYIREYIKTK